MKESNEVVIQTLPRRCPYCDQGITYDSFELKAGENPIQCPSCQKTFIRIISDSVAEGEGR